MADADARITDGARLAGTFGLSEGRRVAGQLSVDRSATRLFLRDDEFFVLDDEKDRNICGTLYDLTKVTLVDCVPYSTMGSGSRYGETYSYSEVGPHFIVSGHRHIDPAAPQVAGMTLRIDDAERIFYDFDAFGVALDPKPAIQALVDANSKRIHRAIRIGADPEIVFFVGEREIASVETAMGTVSITHNPFVNPLASPRRAVIENQILIRLAFDQPISFDASIERVSILMRFLELVGGRPPNIEWSTISIAGDPNPAALRIYWCSQDRRPANAEGNTPHPGEILVDAVRNRGQFETVLATWLANDVTRAGARMRFSSSFRQQNRFDIDRLVGAANMFDILPDDALPSRKPLDGAIATAKDQARALFRPLPFSDERDSILGALGRLGQRTLRQKIEHRAAIVVGGMIRPPGDLSLVIDEAVKCRNHFVHGSAVSIDYDQHWHLMAFLTRALEFLFAAADLLEAGWDAKEWQSRGTILAHPFHIVLHEWDATVDEIRRLRETKASRDGGTGTELPVSQ